MKIYNIQKHNININYCCIFCGNTISKDSAIYGKGSCKQCYYTYLINLNSIERAKNV